ncbi:MAG: PDZ domain-containing protein [Deltaproteobacteria bacterium]|nr:MAG: PDZ domain-containing protein [Deltaproteobacteria bacterium]
MSPSSTRLPTPRSTGHLGSSRLWLGIAVGLAAGTLGAAVASRSHHPVADLPPAEAPDPAPALSSASTTATPEDPRKDPARYTPVVEAVERVAPAVVSITTEIPVNDPFARLWGAPAVGSAEGSGVVIESDGLVLTNAHVVEGASRITATFADGTSHEADVLGITAELDLAVLKLRDVQGLPVVPLGHSADLMLGEPVIAIGNPFGLGLTVTTGVISATRRPLETDERVYQDFLQTDASINPGNSGGPLLDVHGRLVGINTAIRPDAEGIGFAIPVDRAIKIAHDLSKYGQVRSPWLGVDLDDVYIRERPKGSGTWPAGQTAARVVHVYDVGDAAGSSLRVGDVVVEIDGRPVQSRGDLNAYLAALTPGDPVELVIQRPAGDRYRELTLTLATQGLSDRVVEQSLGRVLGIRLDDTTDDGAGARIAQVLPGGAIAGIGGRAGDRIVAVNGRPIRSAADLRAAIAAIKSAHRGDALVTLRRGNAIGRMTLPI